MFITNFILLYRSTELNTTPKTSNIDYLFKCTTYPIKSNLIPDSKHDIASYKHKFDENLYEKYLKTLKTLESKSLELTNYQHKYFELQKMQENMLRNDPSTNYKSLINRIEELNHTIDYLNSSINKATLDKDNTVKEYYFIKKESDNFYAQRINYEETINNLINENEYKNQEINQHITSIEELNKARQQAIEMIAQKDYDLNSLNLELSELSIYNN